MKSNSIKIEENKGKSRQFDQSMNNMIQKNLVPVLLCFSALIVGF